MGGGRADSPALPCGSKPAPNQAAAAGAGGTLRSRAEHGAAGRTAPRLRNTSGCAPALGAGRAGPWGRIFLCFLSFLFLFFS